MTVFFVGLFFVICAHTSHYQNVPFEVPEGWVWCRLGDIFHVIMGQSPEGSSVSHNNQGIEFHQGKLCFNEKYIEKSNCYTDNPTRIAEPNSLLLCVRAPVGIVNITSRKICIGRGLCAIRVPEKMDILFAFYWLKTLESIFNQKATGSTFTAISGDIIKNELIPLPPLSEQHRIVSKIEEYFALINQIEEDKLSLTQFIKQTKTKVLDLAIRGKLVPQDPNDEPASVLLEKIKKEQKTKKMTADILHKKKLEKSIDNQIICKLSDICIFERGITFPSFAKQSIEFPNAIACVRTANVQENLELNDLWYINKSYIKNNPNKLLRKEDIIMSSANSKELVGKTTFIENVQQEMTFGGFVMIIRTQKIDSKFMFYFLRDYFYKGLFSNIATQTTNIANINTTILGEIEVSIPPLAEQHRIVQKIETIFQALDSIQNNL